MLIPEKNYSFVEEYPKNKLTLKKFIKEIYYRMMYDDISLLSANLSYYFILSILPLLVVALALTPYFNINQDYLLMKINTLAPGVLGDYIFSMISEVLNNKSNTLLTFGIIFTLWSASNGIYGLMYAFNIAFRVKEERMWFVVKLISIIFTVIIMIAMFIMLILLVFGRQITWLLFHKFNFDEQFYNIWNYVTYLLPLFFTFFIFVFLYVLATNVKLKISHAMPGAFFATISWIVLSKMFGYYIDHFSNYIKTYGSIGAIMLFVMWLYFTGYVLIIGAEINAILYNYKVENRKFYETHVSLNKGDDSMVKEIYLAGGCFWGVEGYFQQLDGVIETRVGYSNGNTKNTSYKKIKDTDHAEVIYLKYNPNIITLDEIFQHYFRIIDPVSINKQGADIGRQYRTGIYYIDDETKNEALSFINNLQKNYDKKIAVEVQKVNNYVDAEEYHQKYLDKNPTGYCHVDLSLAKKEL